MKFDYCSCRPCPQTPCRRLPYELQGREAQEEAQLVIKSIQTNQMWIFNLLRITLKNLHFVFPPWMCFFWRAREFWNHTWVTRLLSPVTDAIRSRSCPSGLLSIWKLACRTWSCSSVKVVRTRFDLFLWYPSISQPSWGLTKLKTEIQFNLIILHPLTITRCRSTVD